MNPDQLNISKATTVSECLPRLSEIAKERGLKLHLKAEFDKAVKILRNE